MCNKSCKEACPNKYPKKQLTKEDSNDKMEHRLAIFSIINNAIEEAYTCENPIDLNKIKKKALQGVMSQESRHFGGGE